MASPISVAKWFIKNLTDVSVGDVVTHLKVQKLLYFAQAWHMMTLGRPLFEEDMQAWPHGPVAPSVWHEFKQYGWQALPVLEGNCDEGLEEDTLSVLEQVKEIYGPYSAKKLEAMTHAERPWVDARGDRSPEARCEEILPKSSILAYYTEIYGSSDDGKEAA